MRLIVLLYDLLVSRVLIYCKAVKWGLQFANILSRVLCLQVIASHYSGVLSPKFIFSCTTIASIFAYVKCIVSYCCSRENETLRQYPWIIRDSLVKTKFLTKILANWSAYFSTLQYINNLETKRSYNRTLYLKTLKFFKKIIEWFKNYSLIC